MDGSPTLAEEDAQLHGALAAIQLAALFTWGLHGVLSVQVYNYYKGFPRDPVFLKALVYSIWLIEALHVVLVTRDIFALFIAGFGNFIVLNDLHLLPFTVGILGGLIGLLCHLILAYRVLRISQSWTIAGIVAALALGSSASAIAFGSILFKAKTLQGAERITTSSISALFIVCGLWNGFGAGCDAIIAATTTYYLAKTLQKGQRSTDKIITRIIRLTIETGTITATASIVSIVLYVGFRKQAGTVAIYFIIPTVTMAKLYAISIMATFNNRPDPLSELSGFTTSEYTFDGAGKGGRVPIRQILIAQTVVRQVWPSDTMPMSRASEVFKPASEGLAWKRSETDGDNDSTSQVERSVAS
ncbi:hypothetical protein HYPSUDRAFT_217977 [Hypholoma sublateritium FD-334 SS-4]|uniref:DUF6534 domain-containing protein n=1 Tax=Hypholoma sublateritium (strain FD-334 SS-4) TaxID=945553 RepID=A0A0D2NPP3_HYPSF|nr:hypothetical protein HYPSUDRAFT_217977 [Hypholoma sublateritium FD-334 SS-4]